MHAWACQHISDAGLQQLLASTSSLTFIALVIADNLGQRYTVLLTSTALHYTYVTLCYDTNDQHFHLRI